MSDARDKAVVLLSGGLDSATCLAMAQADGLECHALSVDYGQRHRTELEAARRVARARGVNDHRVVRVDLTAIGGSALTEPAIAVPTELSEGIPVTYVPARNTVFLSLALGLAETLDARLLYVGANAVDYSGYPDCRPAFVQAFQELARVATRTGVEGTPWEVRAPLMHLTKADIICAGMRLGVDYAQTVSCYQADDQGRACGQCDSCRIRREGFRVAGVADPTRYRQGGVD